MSRSYKEPWIKYHNSQFIKNETSRKFRRKSHVAEHLSKLNTDVYFLLKKTEAVRGYFLSYKMDASVFKRK